MSHPTTRPRKLGQILGLALMAVGIAWYIFGGMLQDNQSHGYEAGALFVVGMALFLALQ